jgi:hypothetical protein
MKPDDSQVHSHFGSCIQTKLRMLRTLVGQVNKHQIGLPNTIRKVLKHGCLKFPRIVHLDLICMS